MESVKSVKLPGKNKIALLVRRNADKTLPPVLPPLYATHVAHDVVIDEVYASFENKPRTQSLLGGLGYYPVTVNELRNFGRLTDNQIKELILQSKRVTPEQIRQMVESPEAETKYRRVRLVPIIFGLGVPGFIILLVIIKILLSG